MKQSSTSVCTAKKSNSYASNKLSAMPLPVKLIKMLKPFEGFIE
jgi:hypothetical protein